MKNISPKRKIILVPLDRLPSAVRRGQQLTVIPRLMHKELALILDCCCLHQDSQSLDVRSCSLASRMDEFRKLEICWPKFLLKLELSDESFETFAISTSIDKNSMSFKSIPIFKTNIIIIPRLLYETFRLKLFATIDEWLLHRKTFSQNFNKLHHLCHIDCHGDVSFCLH